MFRFYVLVLGFKLFSQVKGCHNQDILCNVYFMEITTLSLNSTDLDILYFQV